MENYRIKPEQHDHQRDEVPTIRVIGFVEGWAAINDIQWVQQEPSVYPTGIRWAGHTVPKGHTPDHLAALGHGVYYLHKHAKLWEIKL